MENLLDVYGLGVVWLVTAWIGNEYNKYNCKINTI